MTTGRSGATDSIYDRMAAQLPGVRFMNSGLAESGDEAYHWLEPADRPFRYHLALMRRVIGDLDLHELRVLEIAAGRGGNCDFLRRYTGAATIVGVDRCWSGLHQARRTFAQSWAADDTPGRHAPRLLTADAGILPLRDETFDVVINVEWSPSYPDFEDFFGEIQRVLAPGGLFLYEDLWSRTSNRLDFARRRSVLLNCGFELIAEDDVTEEAVRALADPGGLESLLRAIQNSNNRDLVDKSLQEAAAARAALAVGFGSARIFRLRKPESKKRAK